MTIFDPTPVCPSSPRTPSFPAFAVPARTPSNPLAPRAPRVAQLSRKRDRSTALGRGTPSETAWRTLQRREKPAPAARRVEHDIVVAGDASAADVLAAVGRTELRPPPKLMRLAGTVEGVVAEGDMLAGYSAPVAAFACLRLAAKATARKGVVSSRVLKALGVQRRAIESAYRELKTRVELGEVLERNGGVPSRVQWLGLAPVTLPKGRGGGKSSAPSPLRRAVTHETMSDDEDFIMREPARGGEEDCMQTLGSGSYGGS